MKINEKESPKPDAKIQHPQYGYVKFFGLTGRQKEILSDYIKIRDESNYKKSKAIVSKKRTLRLYTRIK